MCWGRGDGQERLHRGVRTTALTNHGIDLPHNLRKDVHALCVELWGAEEGEEDRRGLHDLVHDLEACHAVPEKLVALDELGEHAEEDLALGPKEGVVL